MQRGYQEPLVNLQNHGNLTDHTSKKIEQGKIIAKRQLNNRSSFFFPSLQNLLEKFMSLFGWSDPFAYVYEYKQKYSHEKQGGSWRAKCFRPVLIGP